MRLDLLKRTLRNIMIASIIFLFFARPLEGTPKKRPRLLGQNADNVNQRTRAKRKTEEKKRDNARMFLPNGPVDWVLNSGVPKETARSKRAKPLLQQLDGK